MNLRERAAAVPDLAAVNGWPETAEPGGAVETAPLEDISYDHRPIADAAEVPVHIAWSRVMADVQSISKADQRSDTGGRYAFRGVDRVVNAVGPALRRHGVLVLPTRILEVDYREARTTNNKVMQEVAVRVQWTIVGPAGDQLPPMESAGQATDTSDKGTAKAVSVAQRALFLTALHIPTQDPDVDRGHERGEAPLPKAADYRDEITDPRTSLGRLRQIRTELRQHNMGAVTAVNEVGDDEQLLAMCERIGRQRSGRAPATDPADVPGGPDA